ncbi:MAG: DUF2911 domain-containing protein [Gemmatimonadaceae bacterium]
MRSIALKPCVIATLAATLIAATASPQQRSFFVATLGKDTLSFEQYERTAGAIVGDWVSLYGGIMFHHYVITLRPDGSVARYQLTLHRVSGHVDGSIDIQLEGDTAVIRDDRGEEQRAAVGAVFPIFTNSMGPLDLIVSRARALGADSSVTPTMSAFGPFRRGGTPVVFLGRDSVRFGNPLTPLYARVDNDGHIIGMSAKATTTRTETRRVAPYDLRATLAHFPNIPDSVRIVGVPAISPRDTVRATVGDAAITIDYGRPAARGRAVFSRGVLGDSLWRTGANAATQFVTSRDLIVGRDTLRAGSYSLWTSVSPDNSTYALIFNNQTGQWGTEHHPERDVLRVPLATERTKAPIERFTIRLPSDNRGTALRLEWATTVLTIGVIAK